MKLNEIFKIESDTDMLLEMQESELISVERALKPYFKKVMGMNFTFRRHIFDHTTRDDGRERNVSKEEIVQALIKLLRNDEYVGQMKGDKQFGLEYNATVTDRSTDLNMTIAIDYKKQNPRVNLFKVTTIMRKKNFKNKKIKDRHRFYV